MRAIKEYKLSQNVALERYAIPRRAVRRYIVNNNCILLLGRKPVFRQNKKNESHLQKYLGFLISNILLNQKSLNSVFLNFVVKMNNARFNI